MPQSRASCAHAVPCARRADLCCAAAPTPLRVLVLCGGTLCFARERARGSTLCFARAAPAASAPLSASSAAGIAGSSRRLRPIASSSPGLVGSSACARRSALTDCAARPSA
eukprot:7391725-Prymnesium_polylepis.2